MNEVVGSPIGNEERTQENDESEALALVDPNAPAEITSTAENRPNNDLNRTFTVTVKNFSENRSQRKVFTEAFPLGGYDWRVLVFPFGNNTDELSIYLDVANAKSLQAGWTRSAQFSLTVVNHRDPAKSVTRDAHHRFNETESDWGFTQFMKLTDLRDRSKGFLDNDELQIRASVTLIKETYQWGYVNYDSKKETGYVGLKNQGATCYMNSLLQTLFLTNAFRKAVYLMPTENDASATGLALALQRVFYRLQTNTASVGTRELTKSFGWDTYDSFTQHDVQELNRVLCDNLEEKMKGTKVDGEIGRLFEGKVVNYVQCVNVEFRSQRIESYYDLSLNVKGCKDIMESFEKYVEEEMLDGDNKYQAEGHGLQDAKKGVKFMKFPPVLHLQLKRFEYDPQRDAMVKVNDKYEFYQEIDLDKYLAEEAERSANMKNVYQLHSILVHSGDVSGGHYYAFIKPSSEPQWYKFDDERVTKATEEQALSDSFGGSDEDVPITYPKTLWSKKFSNAYMLVYVRKAQFDEILGPVSEEDIPPALVKRFAQERADEDAKRKERNEAHLYAPIKLVTEEDLQKHSGIELVNFDRVLSFKALKSDTFRSLKRIIQEKVGVPVQYQRLWGFARTQSGAIRPERPFVGKNEDKTLNEWMVDSKPHIANNPDIYLYLEIAPHAPLAPLSTRTAPTTPTTPLHSQFIPLQQDESSVFGPYDPEEELLFFKFYDPIERTLEYVGHGFVGKSERLSAIIPLCRRLKGFPDTIQIAVYEEVRMGMIDQIHLTRLVCDSDVKCGAIIVFQRLPLPSSQQAAYPDIRHYYDYINNLVVVRFADMVKKDNEFSLELSKKTPFDVVAQKVADKVGTSPLHLRISPFNSLSESPKSMSWKRSDSRATLQDILNSPSPSPVVASFNNPTVSPNSPASDVLYFEKLDFPVTELDTKRIVRVAWYSSKAEEVRVYTLPIVRDGTVADVISALRGCVKLEDAQADIRVFDVWQHKIGRLLAPTDTITMITDSPIRAEEVAEEEEKRSEHDRLLQCYHYAKEGAMLIHHGVPFYLLVRAAEPLSSVKRRIQTKLGVADDDFAKWKFAFISFGKPDYLADDEVVCAKLQQVHSSESLGLEHADSARPRYHSEKAVRIYH